MSKRIMMLLSIVERDKGKKLRKELKGLGIRVNFQFAGSGTAPTEMMDIFGLGTNDKDIILSLGSESDVRAMMQSFGANFSGYSKYGGIMIVFSVSAASRILAELLNYEKDTEKGTDSVKNEHQNNLIIISVNEGYTEDVMHVARKAGATGGTVVKGRLADIEQFAELGDTTADSEREVLFILAPDGTGRQIMENINKEFGLTSPANGIVFAVPTEKAYKI